MTAQPVTIPFTNGIDTRNPARLVQSPYLLAAKDCYFNSDAGLRKRNGHAALSKNIVGGGTLKKGTSVCAFQKELLAFDDTYLYSWSPAYQAWAQRDVAIPTTTKLRPVAVNGYTQICCDYAYTDYIEAWVYQDTRNPTDVRLTVADVATGAFLIADEIIASNRISPRFARTTGGAWVLLAAGVNANTANAPCALYGRAFTGTVGSPVGPELTITATLMGPMTYDVAYDGTTGVIAFMEAYVQGLGNPSALGQGPVTVAPLSPTGRLATATESGYALSHGAQYYYSAGGYYSYFTANQNRISIAFDPTRSGYVFVAIGTDQSSPNPMQYRGVFINAKAGASWTWTDPSVSVFSTSGTYSDIGALPARYIIAYVDPAGVGWLYANTQNPVFKDSTWIVESLGWDTLVFSTASPATMSIMYGRSLMARPFVCNGDTYFWMTNSPHPVTSQPTAFVYNQSRSRVVARMAVGTAGIQSPPPIADSSYMPAGGSPFANPIPNVANTATEQWQVPLLSASNLISQNGKVTTEMSAYNFVVNFISAWQLQSARYGDNQVFCGGLVLAYDGASVTEQGFLLAPEIIYPSWAPGLTYQYCAIWEYTDEQGQLHRSAPSVIFSNTSTGATYYFAPLVFTNKTNVNLVLYRTTANGQIFQRTTPFGTPVFNDPTQPFIKISDNGLTDADLENNEILYTVGGELQNDAAPSCKVMCATKDRLLVAGGDDGSVVTLTKPYAKGLGSQFSLALQVRVSILQGDITAVGAMDDYVIVFKNPGIFYFSGNGPSADGTNNDFTQVEMLTDELGCVNPQSLIYTQDGLYFQSAKGLYLLTRGLELVYMGAPVQAYNEQTIVSAVMMPTQQQVRFGCIEDEAPIYHYRMLQQFGNIGPVGQWTTFRRHAQLGACLWNGAYAFIRSDGSVWVESSDHQDPTGPVAMYVQTAWLKIAGLLEAGQFRELALLGDYLGPHILNIDIAHDYLKVLFGRLQYNAANGCHTSAWGDDETWGASSWGGDCDDAYVFHGRLPVQTAAMGAIQLTIYDTGIAGESFDNSATLEAIALMAEAAPRLLRAGLKKQVG